MGIPLQWRLAMNHPVQLSGWKFDPDAFSASGNDFSSAHVTHHFLLNSIP